MRNPRALQILAIAALSLLASCRADDGAAMALIDASQDSAQTAPTGAVIADSCPGMGDIFELDVPGTYTAFALHPSGSMVTEVRGTHGEMLATTHPMAANTAAVDIVSGARFDISPPHVFEVEAGVIIHVQHGNSPYELVLVRIGGTAKSGIDVRPPVEHVVRESGSSLIGDLRETFKIHTDAVYSDLSARQVFLVESPNRLADH